MRGSSVMLRAVLAVALPLAAALHAQTEPRPEDRALVDRVVDALRKEDATALAALVDFPRRADEQIQRGKSQVHWADLDEAARQQEEQTLCRAWVRDDPAFSREAVLQGVVELPDPDAGHGPVPDRRILQAVMLHEKLGALRDLLFTVTPDSRVLDFIRGPRYYGTSNPAGKGGLRPIAELTPPERPAVIWPADTSDLERHDARQFVLDLIGLPLTADRWLPIERLHHMPRPAVAALVERLDQFDQDPQPDVEAEVLISETLTHITGRSSLLRAKPALGMDDAQWRRGNHEAVLEWLEWQRKSGATFVPVPIEKEPEDATAAAAAGAGAGAATDPAANAAPGGLAGGSAPGNAAGGAPGGAGTPGGTVPPGGAPPPGGSTAGSAPGNTAGSAPGAPGSTPAPASTPGVVLPPPGNSTSPRDILFPAAADLKFLLDKRAVTGREVERTLSPAMREALNAWAEPATRLGLRVAATADPEHLVIGSAPEAILNDAAAVIDRTWKLLDPLLPLAPGHEPRAVVAFLFDEKGTRSPAWGGLLDLLVERRLMFESAAEPLRKQPAGLMLRGAGVFLQTGFDVAGNAAAGDDEFRLDNELMHKYAQCLATVRLGQLPPVLLWGLGEVVEIRFTKSVYMLNVEGFVATGDHFDWPQRSKQMLEKRAKKRDASLSAAALKDSAAGQAAEPQMVVWAALAYLSETQPAALRDMLLDLAELQVAADPRRRASVYVGDAVRTADVLKKRLDSLDTKELIRWLDR